MYAEPINDTSFSCFPLSPSHPVRNIVFLALLLCIFLFITGCKAGNENRITIGLIASLTGPAGRGGAVATAWQRWAPVVAQLPLAGWSARERRALAAIIAAKGGRSERDFLRLFDDHPRVAAALRALCRA